VDGGEGPRSIRVVVEVVDPHHVGPHPYLSVVDALARLQLAARQAGCTIRLQAPSTELLELLDLVGLADLVAGTPAGGTPAGGTPAGGTPAGGTPAGGTPAGGTPAADPDACPGAGPA